MKLSKYILAVGAAAAICASSALAETIYDANGNVIGSFRDTGVNKYFYDQNEKQAFAARLGDTTGTQIHANQNSFREVYIGATWPA